MSLSVLLAVAFVGAALYYVCPLRFRWVLLLLLRRRRTNGLCVALCVEQIRYFAFEALSCWSTKVFSCVNSSKELY